MSGFGKQWKAEYKKVILMFRKNAKITSISALNQIRKWTYWCSYDYFRATDKDQL